MGWQGWQVGPGGPGWGPPGPGWRGPHGPGWGPPGPGGGPPGPGGGPPAPWSSSDIRLKQDIVELSRLDNGLGLYRYRYNWSDQVYVGVMAQEVAEVFPDAVVRGPDGYLLVNYQFIWRDLMTWDEWLASRPEPHRLAN